MSKAAIRGADGFVGESATGSAIMAQGAATLKRVHFELGGKNPVIVFDDADLERALDAAAFMIYSLNGERCTSSSRLLVQASIYDEFVARMAERVKSIRLGHPLDPATELGPLVHRRHAGKVAGYFDIAREEGVEIPAGGAVAEVVPGGYFVEPTPFGGIKESGIGRDGGDYSFDFYMETKNVCLALGSHGIPQLGRN